MNLTPSLGLIDLSQVVAMLASFGGMSGALSYLRALFLDALLSGLNATQRDYILRSVNYLLNFAFILGASLLVHEPFSVNLLFSVAVVAAGASGLGHMTYHLAVNSKLNAEPSYPEIPEDPDPTPPDDAPMSAPLANAA